MEHARTLESLAAAARVLTAGDDRTVLRTLQTAKDALDAAMAARIASLDASKDFELDGASTLNTWVRNELRVGAKDARALVRSGSTLLQLPDVAEAAAIGAIRLEHVDVFAYGLKHIGAQIITESQSWLLDVARANEPAELFRIMKDLREAIYPDDLDKAWADGMDKQDIQVTPVLLGFHVNGFLNTITGAKLKALIDSVSKPHDKDDTRSGSERRVQGLDDVLTKVLESGLPSDKGVRPHLSVMADAQTLQAFIDQQNGKGSVPVLPARLTGFGNIGPKLFGYLFCQADITPIITSGGEDAQSRILNVGRSHRVATVKQRRGVLARQDGECATPGCHHTHLEIHHVIWWSRGGQTNIDLLIGICSACHHLVHRGLLVITGDATTGFTFTDRDNRALKREFRDRVARHRENWQIRKIAVRHERRHDLISRT